MTKTQFRIAVVLPVVVECLALVASLAGESSLPPLLQEHLDQDLEGDLTAADWVVIALALPLLAGFLASFIGMLRFRPHSRSLSVAVTLVALVFFPLYGPTVEPGLATALNYLSSMLYGAVIAISYHPPVSGWFQDKARLAQAS
jgi:hypothetical protein